MMAARTTLIDLYIRAREGLLNSLAGARSSPAVNGGVPAREIAASDELAANLRRTLMDLKAAAMDVSGARVDYAALRRSDAYIAYREQELATLHVLQPETMRDVPVRRAFWINLYNALALDAVIFLGVKQSVAEGPLGIFAFYRRAAYVIGGCRVSLEDIEHGLLRANRGNPFVPGPHFTSDDPRLAWMVPLDPRIHFALNCGARSCPPIRAYAPEELHQQLQLATRSFINATVEIDPEANQVTLSRLFKWYRNDFGGQGGVIEFIRRHLPDEKRRLLEARWRDVNVRYAAYDWQLNDL